MNHQLNTNRTILDGFVEIHTKNVVSNIVPKITTFWQESLQKTVENRPICKKLTVSKLQEFAIFKKPKSKVHLENSL